VATRIRTVV